MIIKSIKIKLEGNPYYYILRLQGVGVEGSQYKNKCAVALGNDSLIQKSLAYLESNDLEISRSIHSIEFSFYDSNKNLWSILEQKDALSLIETIKLHYLTLTNFYKKLCQTEKVTLGSFDQIKLINTSHTDTPRNNIFCFFNISDIKEFEYFTTESSSFTLYLSQELESVNNLAKTGIGWGYTNKVAL